MVLAGQYLERPTLIVRVPATDEQTGITLEGLYHRGSQAPGLVICAPHPRMGGSMDSPVVAELAWALTRAGHATLRFNYQGVGASEGELHAAAAPPSGPQPLSSVESEAEDALAAVKHLAASVEHQKVALVGYSFGAAVALQLALRTPTLSHLILVAPPTSLFDFSALRRVTQPCLIVAGHRDAWVDRAQIGTLVQEQERLGWEVIANADHTFSQGLTELGRVAASWLNATR